MISYREVLQMRYFPVILMCILKFSCKIFAIPTTVWYDISKFSAERTVSDDFRSHVKIGHDPLLHP